MPKNIDLSGATGQLFVNLSPTGFGQYPTRVRWVRLNPVAKEVISIGTSPFEGIPDGFTLNVDPVRGKTMTLRVKPDLAGGPTVYRWASNMSAAGIKPKKRSQQAAGGIIIDN